MMEQIDLNGKSNSIQSVIGMQTKMFKFSNLVSLHLQNRNNDSGKDVVCHLVNKLKTFDRFINRQGITSFFQYFKIRCTKVKYFKLEKDVQQVEMVLEKYFQTFSESFSLLNKLCEENEQYCKDLSMYIHEVEDKEDINDLEQCEKISLQLATQLSLVRKNCGALMEEIKSCIVHISLWRNQMTRSFSFIPVDFGVLSKANDDFFAAITNLLFVWEKECNDRSGASMKVKMIRQLSMIRLHGDPSIEN